MYHTSTGHSSGSGQAQCVIKFLYFFFLPALLKSREENHKYFRKETAQGIHCRRDEHFRKYLLFLAILIPAGDFWFFSSKEKNKDVFWKNYESATLYFKDNEFHLKQTLLLK